MNNIISLSRFRSSDDMKTFADAMSYMRDNSGTTLVIEPGIYNITGDLGRKTQADVMNGIYGGCPSSTLFSRNFPYSSGVSLDGHKNSRIIADGAIFMVNGFMQPLSVTGCENIIIQGLEIDYLRKPYSMGIITDINSDGEMTVKFGSEYPISDSIPYPRTCIYNKNTSKFDMSYKIDKVHYMGNQVLRLCCSGLKQEFVGGELYIAHTWHSRPAVLVENSKNVYFRDMKIRCQPGMGIVGHRSNNIFMDGVSIVPCEGSHFSTNTDATHFTSCRGILKMNNCTFVGHGDDAINVHTYYHTIKKIDEFKCRLSVDTVMGTHSQTLDYPDRGDILELSEKATMKVVDRFTVMGVIPNHEQWYADVTLDKSFDYDADLYYFGNASQLPILEVTNSSFKNHFARSVLIKARTAIVENCSFYGAALGAIVVSAEPSWKEGLSSDSILIKNNKIEDCGGGIIVTAELSDKSVICHNNVIIEHNHINCPKCDYGVVVTNTANVQLFHNSVKSRVGDLYYHTCENVTNLP